MPILLEYKDFNENLKSYLGLRWVWIDKLSYKAVKAFRFKYVN